MTTAEQPLTGREFYEAVLPAATASVVTAAVAVMRFLG